MYDDIEVSITLTYDTAIQIRDWLRELTDEARDEYYDALERDSENAEIYSRLRQHKLKKYVEFEEAFRNRKELPL